MAKAKKSQETPVFNPEASYGWNTHDTLTLSGLELDVLNKAFEAVLASPYAQPVLAAQQGKQAVASILKRNVESGAIKAMPEEDK